MAATGVLMVLIAHGHYTVDVIIAYLVTTRLFWIYHTLANNVYLKVRLFSFFLPVLHEIINVVIVINNLYYWVF